MPSKTHTLLGAGTLVLSGLAAAAGPAATGPALSAPPSESTSWAQTVAQAWLDEGLLASLRAQGIDVPPRPDDIADEELDTAARATHDPATYAAVCDRGTWAFPTDRGTHAAPTDRGTWAFPSDRSAYPCDRGLWAHGCTCR